MKWSSYCYRKIKNFFGYIRLVLIEVISSYFLGSLWYAIVVSDQSGEGFYSKFELAKESEIKRFSFEFPKNFIFSILLQLKQAHPLLLLYHDNNGYCRVW